MGLTLMRAIQMGVPIIASDLPPVRELVLSGNGLVPPGDVFLWSQAIIGMLDSGKTQTEFDGGRIPDIRTMTEKIVEVYEFILGQR